MNMLSKKTALVVAAILFLGSTFSVNANPVSDEVLEVGSKAPALDVENWVNGNKTPVTSFESGNVYVVEFWATWCGPCIASMPHLSELQEKYKSKGVRVISISDEDVETVEEFLERNVRGDDEKTYRELTSAYSLTADPDLSSHNDYMKASGQNGIPAAYIVGKDGHIEWMGHPAEIDEPLESITAGKWDRDAYVKKAAADKKAMAAIQKALRTVGQKMQAGETDEAVEVIDGLIKDHGKTSYVGQLKMMRLQMLMSSGHDKAGAALVDFAKENDDPQMLNQLAWSIVEMKNGGEEVSDDIMKAAVKMAEKGVKASPNNGPLLDTLAHLYHFEGDLDKAIATQKKAVANAGDFKDQIEPFLEELLEEKAKQ